MRKEYTAEAWICDLLKSDDEAGVRYRDTFSRRQVVDLMLEAYEQGVRDGAGLKAKSKSEEVNHERN